jgi:serine/threonine protein kinase
MNIIHRDVSPQNVLVSFRGQVKLIDFGIAKSASRLQPSQAGVLKGKLGYMSPEQAVGGTVDRRSDLFSLGIVLHEMLTGQRLFTADSDYAILEKVRSAPIPSLRGRTPAIPELLERIVLKALAREVEQRYAWASELAEDLRAFLGSSSDLEEVLGGWLSRVCAPELAAERDRDQGREFPIPGTLR